MESFVSMPESLSLYEERPTFARRGTDYIRADGLGGVSIEVHGARPGLLADAIVLRYNAFPALEARVKVLEEGQRAACEKAWYEAWHSVLAALEIKGGTDGERKANATKNPYSKPRKEV